MDLASLRLFRIVAETGSVTAAAGQLCCVQSNVSARLRQLEDDLGIELFRRDRRRLFITPAGEILLGYARRLQSLADEARAAVRGDEPGGTLRLGSMETTAAIRLPQVLPAFHRRHPAVQLVLDTLPTRQAVSAVLEYRLDAAFVCGPVTEPGLEGCPVWCEAPCLIAEAGLSLAEATVAPVLLTFGAGCAYRDRLEDWCRVRGIVPATVLEFRSFQAILGCVAAGMGIALLPRSVLDDPASAHLGLAVHDLPAEAAPMQTWLVWRRGWQSPALRALCASLPADGASSAAC